MTNPRRALPVAVLAVLAACATMRPVLTKVDHAVDCSESKVVAQLPGIITDVVTDLVSVNYAKLLADLAQRAGDDLVVCAVAASTSGTRARLASAAGAQPNAEAIAAHGDAYLAQRQVTFAPPPRGAAVPVTCYPACDACHTCTFVPVTGQKPMNPWHCFSIYPKPSTCQ